ncbi:hypothetical protein [Tenacibaculum agarivorans]|uniref:hypothetical protein n=1 Tax=Tenacibaculum agarivorans TaxID=1908389 RepID=UPI00094B8DC1|nr:hypothetical protein [Tenacibaculum agarivorans]
MKTRNPLAILLISSLLFLSCSEDDNDNTNPDPDQGSGDPVSQTCDDPSKFIFNEKESFVLVEMENSKLPDKWALKTSNSATGKGYYVWEGDQSLGKPGNGLIEFTIKINNPGNYRFLWNTAVTIGSNGTEHNDSWLKFPDADDFYGEKKDGSRVYPKGSGKTPNPKGSSADGWFKIYRGGNDLDFKWQAATSDNDSHNVYVEFKKAGEYTMQVSARSTGHGIDKFMLFNEANYSEKEAKEKATFSEITCN